MLPVLLSVRHAAPGACIVLLGDADAIDPSLSSWSALLFALAALGEVLAIVFVYRVLVRGGSPASTVLWMATILLAPWFGLLLYYLLPRRLQLRRLRRVRVRGDRLREVRSSGDGGPTDGDDGRRTSGLEALLRLGDGGIAAGNAARWLATGEEFFAAAAAAIARATRHVHCVVYIIRPDATGQRFLASLAEAAQRGVAVRLCYDSVGSFRLKAAHLAALRAAGGRAEPFLPLFWKRRPFTINLRNHRKLLIVDGEVAFVGGRNVGDEYRSDRLGRRRRWLDAMLAVEGPVVDQLQEVFVQDWCTSTDEVLSDTFRPAASPDGDEVIGVVQSGPDRERPGLWFALVQAIAEARDRIELSSPYLVPPPTLAFALRTARARGVQVRIYTNGPGAEIAFLYHAQRHHYRALLADGVEIYETTDQYNHAKFLVVDGRVVVVVGSANMDLRSAHLNFEIAVVALDAPALANRVSATVADRRSAFRRVSVADLPQSPLSRVVDALCGLFSPLL